MLSVKDVFKTRNETAVIAEIGINHNGDIKIAKKMIEEAASAGADSVKFQKFTARNMYPEKSKKLDYIVNKESIYDVVKKYEMPVDWVAELMDYSKQHGLIFFSSVCSEEDADEMRKAGMQIFKITSSELTHIPLIKHTASFRKPLLLSTGLSTGYGVIEDAINACAQAGNNKIGLFHCIAIYPAPLKDCNLGVIPLMKKIFGAPVGWSDHTEDPVKTPYLATILGADMIEKHFTLDRKMPGPDQHFAVEPKMLKAMVTAVREAEGLSESEKQKILQKNSKIVGDGIRHAVKGEEYLRKFVNRTIIAKKNIDKGEMISKENVSVLRPGGAEPGIEPKFFDTVIGSHATRDIKVGRSLTWDDLLLKKSR